MAKKKTEKEDKLPWAMSDILSDIELFSVGRIISQWGALEHEIFVQTLETFPKKNPELPKDMDNLKFKDGVLKLWKERVVDKSTKKKKEVLLKQYNSILKYLDFRHALVHGMWEWDQKDPEKITTVRIRKKNIIYAHFDAESLEDFAFKIAEINFAIRYPRGATDMAKEMAKQGGYMSRSFLAQVTKNKIADDFYVVRKRVKLEEASKKPQ